LILAKRINSAKYNESKSILNLTICWRIFSSKKGNTRRF